jgi:hypothetical protein
VQQSQRYSKNKNKNKNQQIAESLQCDEKEVRSDILVICYLVMSQSKTPNLS